MVDPDEIAAWVAELDFEVAEPIRPSGRERSNAATSATPPINDTRLAEAVADWYATQYD